MCMKLAHPEWAMAAWLVAIATAGMLFFLYQRHSQLVRWIPTKIRLASPLMRIFLRGGVIFFLLLAWIEPTIDISEESENQADKIVWYLLDVSASMQTPDVLPSRMSFAREAVIASIARMKGAKVGVILFSSSALIQVPLTRDRNAAQVLAALVSGHELSTGPARFRQALLLAHRRTEAATNATQQAVNVVLISDGEADPENYASVLHRLKQNGSVVWPVAVATEAGGTIPNISQNGASVVSRLELSGFEAIKTIFGKPILIVTAAPEKALEGIEQQFVLAVQVQKQQFSLRSSCLLIALAFGIATYIFRPQKIV